MKKVILVIAIFICSQFVFVVFSSNFTSAITITHSISNDPNCPPSNCLRRDPNNPVPPTLLDWSADLIFPQFDSNLGILEKVSFNFFIPNVVEITGDVGVTGQYGWEIGSTATLSIPATNTIMSESFTGSGLTDPGQPLLAGTTYHSFRGDDHRFNGVLADTAILGTDISSWIGNGSIIANLSVSDPILNVIMEPTPNAFTLTSSFHTAELLFASVNCDFQSTSSSPIPDPPHCSYSALA